jgi:hypothetical protein
MCPFSIAADSKMFCSRRGEPEKTLLRCFRGAVLLFLYNRSHRRRSAWAVEWLYFPEFWKTNLAPALSRGFCCEQVRTARLSARGGGQAA